MTGRSDWSGRQRGRGLSSEAFRCRRQRRIPVIAEITAALASRAAPLRKNVRRSDHVRDHHRDQSHVGAVEVSVENSEGNEKLEGSQQRDEEAAETLHRYR
ncbi:hypothetical protein F7725_013697 [Dissostichus mawsoni]|uniref:Uncharacterized protein n=1 Tax=Dissostichus mawsoni TaxID=36200 RepID=A0A7J5YWA3_DISMA|nr:hypothetical protein F7725_013697 [Dissostichus mawsoni]